MMSRHNVFGRHTKYARYEIADPYRVVPVVSVRYIVEVPSVGVYRT
jgi:hypothetical protein